jgi:hypothetical protein
MAGLHKYQRGQASIGTAAAQATAARQPAANNSCMPGRNIQGSSAAVAPCFVSVLHTTCGARCYMMKHAWQLEGAKQEGKRNTRQPNPPDTKTPTRVPQPMGLATRCDCTTQHSLQRDRAPAAAARPPNAAAWGSRATLPHKYRKASSMGSHHHCKRCSKGPP